jgi:hypothetical protein
MRCFLCVRPGGCMTVQYRRCKKRFLLDLSLRYIKRTNGVQADQSESEATVRQSHLVETRVGGGALIVLNC